MVIDAGEARAVRLLEQAGLVPGSRHRRVGPTSPTGRPAPGPGSRRATMGRARAVVDHRHLTQQRAADLRDELVRLGQESGLAAVGIAEVEVFEDTRADARGTQATGSRRGDAVHLPKPGAFDRPVTASCPAPARSSWARGATRRLEGEAADERAGHPAGSVARATRAATTTTRSVRRSPSSPDVCRISGGVRRWSATTTRSSTGPRRIGRVSAGSVRTHCSWSTAWAPGSCSGRS